MPSISLGVVALGGCSGSQSALDVAGRDAATIAELFWWMAGGAALVWLVMVGLTIYSMRVEPGVHPRRVALYVIGGGVAAPTSILAVLLAFGLSTLPELLAPAPPGSPRVQVIGEQWWWRVRYLPADGEPIESANEIHLPVGQRVDLLLGAADVIHSVWIPPLGGKMDMIPGRETRLSLEPIRTGTYRGVCAEYCGEAHALMQLIAVVEEPASYRRWLERERSPARPPPGAAERRGAAAFAANGCGACHTVRGTSADGVLGPDLTHVAARRSIGSGILPPTREAFRRWLSRTAEIKPGVHMPTFGMLAEGDLDDLAAYMAALE